MPSRRLEDLQPDVRALAEQWVVECNRARLLVLVYETLRTPQEQAETYWRGRTKQSVQVKASRLAASGHPRLAQLLLSIGPVSPLGGIVTQAGPGESMHQYGLAWDACPLNDAGKPDWVVGPKWHQMGRIAERLGIEWGGDWKFTDMPHFQVTGGRSVHALMAELEASLGPDQAS